MVNTRSIVIISNRHDVRSTADSLAGQGFQIKMETDLSPAELAGYDLALVEAHLLTDETLQTILPIISLVGSEQEINPDYEYLMLGEFNPVRFDVAWRSAESRHRLHQNTRMLENSLKHTEERFQNTIMVSTDGVLVLSADGVVLYANPSAQQLFERANLIGSLFGFPVVSNDSTELELIQKSGQRLVAEMRVVETQWFGNEAFLAMLRDVTKRRVMEDNLRIALRSNKQLLTAVASINIGVIIADATAEDLPTIFVNPGFTKITGYAPQEMLGTNCRLLQGPGTDRAVIAEISAAIKSGESFKGTILNYRKDGTPFWNDLLISPVYADDGSLVNFIGLQEDVTDRIMTEAALAANQEMLTSIIQSSPVGILTMDLDGKVNLWNPNCELLFGWEREAVIGQKLPVVPAEKQHELMTLIKSVGQDKALLSLDTSWVRRDDTPISISISAAPMHHTQGQVNGILFIISDNTERQRLEQERNEAQHLRIDLQKEKELRQMRMHFMSMVSHEFRTPLTSISSSSEILERYFDKLDLERRSIHLKRIQEQVWHLVEMLEDILSISRAENLRPEFREKEVDLVSICQEAVSDARLSSSAKHVILFDASSSSCIVEGDMKLLSRTINNLISNAVKYSPDGGSVVIELNCNEEHVNLSVSDHGIGIPPQDIEHIFNAFRRGENVGTIQGTGLGLAIASQAIELHGGNIQVTSQVGQGTRFIVWIPRQQVE